MKFTERMKIWRKDNPERHQESNKLRNKRWKELNPDYVKGLARVRTYRYRLRQMGITEEEIEKLYIEQNNCCAICLIPFSKNEARWSGGSGRDKPHIDHCHISGKIRGILCRSCNLGIGHFQDKIEALEKAIEYLKNNETTHKTQSI